MHKLPAVILLTALILLAFPACALNSDDLIIIHTNDVHARFAENLGYGTAAAIIDDIRSNYSHVILLDAGDVLHGMPEANLYNGSSAVEIMNLMGYDAMTPGNHDFNYSLDELKRRASEMQFPLLSANIFDAKTGKDVFQEHTILRRGNYTVGIFGFTTPQTLSASTIGRKQLLTIAAGENLYAIAAEQVKELREAGCNVIICLAHLGMNSYDAPSRSIDVAEHVDGIDVIVDGHSHSFLEEGYLAGNTTIVSTGSYLDTVGVVTIFSNGTISPKLVSSYPAMNETIEAAALSYVDQTREKYARVIGTSEVALNGSRNPGVRTAETNLGDLCADAMYSAAEKEGLSPDAAITNGGGIRTSIEAGNISQYDILQVLPFCNLISVIDVKGDVIRQVLEANTAVTPEESGGFPQVSHMNYTISTGKTENRVVIESIGGRPFDADTLYRIALPDFIAEGGDAYAAFAEYYSGVTSGVTLEDAVARYIEEDLRGVVGSLYAEPAGRIRITNESSPAASPVLPFGALAGIICAVFVLRRW